MNNKAYRTRVRGTIKNVRQALDAQDAPAAQAALGEAITAISKAASKGVLHWKNASRKISRLSKHVHSLQA